MSEQTLLSVRNLRVFFGDKEVVRDVSFDLAAGEKLALVGESGSGKTITALSLQRLAGDARLQGQATAAYRLPITARAFGQVDIFVRMLVPDRGLHRHVSVVAVPGHR